MEIPYAVIARSWLAVGVVFLLCMGNINGQETQEEEKSFIPYIYLNGNAQAGIPISGFERAGQQKGYGGGGLLLVQVGQRPLFAGLEIGFQRFDDENLFFVEVINGYSEEFEQTTKNNVFLGHAVFRFQPLDNSLFRPYLDGLFGVKNFYTRTTLKNLDTEETQSETNLRDWSWSYGFAAGLQLGVFRNKAITIDLRCVYLTGLNATFMVRDPDGIGPYISPLDAFVERNAPASMLIPQIGLSVDLTTVMYY